MACGQIWPAENTVVRFIPDDSDGTGLFAFARKLSADEILDRSHSFLTRRSVRLLLRWLLHLCGRSFTSRKPGSRDRTLRPFGINRARRRPQSRRNCAPCVRLQRLLPDLCRPVVDKSLDFRFSSGARTRSNAPRQRLAHCERTDFHASKPVNSSRGI